MIRQLIPILLAAVGLAAAAPAQTIEQRVAALEQRVAAIDGQSETRAPTTQPIPAPPVVGTPTPATRPAGPKRRLAVPDAGDAARLSVKGMTLADVAVAGTPGNNGSAIRIAADNVVVSNVDITGAVGQYLIVIDSGRNILLDHVTINGASDWQSHCRTMDPSSSLTLRECRFVDTSPKDKAILRGPGRWFIDGGYFAGAAIGPANPLGHDDGGQGILVNLIHLGVKLDKNATWTYHVKNDVEVRKALADAAKLTSDPKQLAKVFRFNAILWTDDFKTRTVACKDVCPDSQLQINIDLRAVAIASSGQVTAKNGATFGRGISLEAGNAWTMDGTCRVETSGPAIAGYTLSYPEAAFLQRYDKPRPAPTWTGNGDVINAGQGWGVPDDVARKLLRGWFILNGKRVDFGPVSMFIGPADDEIARAA